MVPWLLWSSLALALGDAATHFQVFVPPNNVPGRDVSVAITAVSGGTTTVALLDDGLDGDTDDTVSDIVLRQGETYVMYPREGSVNDDAGGKQDGDYYTITSDQPVVALVSTDSNWQHDWAPSDGRSSRGTSFFLWSPPTSGQPADLDVFSYVDGTRITIEDVTTSPTTSTGITQVDLSNGTIVLDTTLDEGEDLHRRFGLGVDLFEEGHTYWIRASEAVTVQAGHLDTLDGANQARDGGGFVPGVSGGAFADLYYLSIPHNPGRTSEKELRAVAWEDYAEVSLYGWSEPAGAWNLLDVVGLDAWETADWVGATDGTFASYDLYKVAVANGADVALFEANWMETGAPGTSDYLSSVSSSDGTGVGTDFVAYLGPPGDQRNWAGGVYARLDVYAAEDDVTVDIRDLNTNGATHFQQATVLAGGYHTFLFDEATWNQLNDPANDLRPYVLVRSDGPISVTTGNPNDNFMAWLTSPLLPEPTVAVELSHTTLTCGTSATLEVTIGNSMASTLAGGRLDIDVPEELTVTVLDAPAHGSPVLTDDGITLTAPDLGPSETQTLLFDLSFPCDDGCPPEGLVTVTATRTGQAGSLVYGTNATASVDLLRTDGDRVRDLQAAWNEGLGATEVSWAVDGPLAGTMWRLERASGPAGPWTLLEAALADGSSTSYLTTDGALASEDDVFYRVQAVDDLACTVTYGPMRVAVESTPSGASGGGLESNGRLAAALARRAVARTRGWDPLLEPTTFRSTPLAQYLPDEGPNGSTPFDGTPWDLPGVTNAVDAVAADYIDANGEHVASLLLVQTIDEPYEHSKALCDRASGGSLEHVQASPLDPDHSLPRARMVHSSGAGEWSTSVVVVHALGEPARAYAPWLADTLPQQPAGTAYISVQAWSTESGLDLTLAQDAMQELGATTLADDGLAPPHWVRSASFLGGKLHVELGGEGDTSLEIATRSEAGVWTRTRHHADDALTHDLGPALEATVTVLTEAGGPSDRAWTSDGAWAAFDDGIWGGESTTTSFEALCEEGGSPEVPSGLRLAGCARAEAAVAPGGFAGLARHLARPVDAGQGLAVWIARDRPIEVCAHGDAGQRPCASFDADPEGSWVGLDFDSFRAEHGPLTTVSLVEIATHQEGLSTVDARGLVLTDEPPPFAAAPTNTPLTVGPDSAGCGCAGSSNAPVGTLPLAALALAFRRRRGHRGEAQP